jgi:hypothetical protein
MIQPDISTQHANEQRMEAAHDEGPRYISNPAQSDKWSPNAFRQASGTQTNYRATVGLQQRAQHHECDWQQEIKPFLDREAPREKKGASAMQNSA